MDAVEGFNKFVSSEKDHERLAQLVELVRHQASWQRDVLLWRVLGLMPTKHEKARLASAIRLTMYPSSAWTVTTCLMKDADQDIVGNAINSLTFSRNRALGHRALRLFDTAEPPQRVLYCLARYAEETTDRRFSNFIAPHLHGDLSDAFLARSFNALFRLGVKDPLALRVAEDLISSHIEATNMDRKAAVAAIVYAFFAGSRQQLEKIREIRDRVGIPELRRLLNWGLAHIDDMERLKFGAAATQIFFQRACSELEPNFTGFGCLNAEILAQGLKTILQEQSQTAEAITRTVLALGEPFCIDILAEDSHIGLSALLKSKNEPLLSLWRSYLPTHSERFVDSVLDTANFEIWHHKDPEVLFSLFSTAEILPPKTTSHSWQAKFEALSKTNFLAATDILCAQILALERETNIKGEKDVNPEICQCIVQNLELCVNILNKNAKQHELRNEFTERIYGICVGGLFPKEFYSEVARVVPFSLKSWAFNGVALYAPDLEQHVVVEAIIRTLSEIGLAMRDGSLNRDEFTLQVISRLQALIIGTERFHATIPKSLLTKITQTMERVQSIFDSIDAAKEPEPVQENADDGDEFGGADWNGHISLDKPILRWNAILQICFNPDLSPKEKTTYGAILLEGLRIAPHVEKRWIVRALVTQGTDDAVKAILYQAFQHIDVEFVAHSIRELLPSKHPRAQQALIRCVGRSTIPDDLKLQILDEISLDNPEEVLKELRTLEILRLPQHIDDAVRDAVGRVAALIDIDTVEANARENTKKNGAIDVDLIIAKLLPKADSLSVDVRSALRTAEMIFLQSQEWGAEAVDLSPIVNMHFKAVELIMREVFEPYSDSIVRHGHFSHKLDLLGYARPIPEKMQVFEDYLASLSVVRTIPYFSKFKLRKMLRAICLFRPGKRFTLDGPKAFALLFLVTSRKTCQFGLEKIFDIGFNSDADLFEFVKIVHSLQDCRNRAVHEGLTWEAKDEIEGMRSQAYCIIEHCMNIHKYLKQTHVSGGTLHLSHSGE